MLLLPIFQSEGTGVHNLRQKNEYRTAVLTQTRTGGSVEHPLPSYRQTPYTRKRRPSPVGTPPRSVGIPSDNVLGPPSKGRTPKQGGSDAGAVVVRHPDRVHPINRESELGDPRNRAPMTTKGRSVRWNSRHHVLATVNPSMRHLGYLSKEWPMVSPSSIKNPYRNAYLRSTETAKIGL